MSESSRVGAVTAVYSLARSPDGTHLFVGGLGGLQLLRAADGAVVRTYPVEGHRLAVAVNADGTRVAVRHPEQGLSVFDAASGGRVMGCSGAFAPANVVIRPDGRTVLLGRVSPPGYGSVWSIRYEPAGGLRLVASGLNGPPSVIACSDDGRTGLWVSGPRCLLYDFRLGHLVGCPGSGLGITALRFTPDSRAVVVGTKNGRILVWRVRAGAGDDSVRIDEPPPTPPKRDEPVRGLAVSPDGGLVAARFPRSVVVWRLSGTALGAEVGRWDELGGTDDAARDPLVFLDHRTLITGDYAGLHRLVIHLDQVTEERTMPATDPTALPFPDVAGATRAGGYTVEEVASAQMRVMDSADFGDTAAQDGPASLPSRPVSGRYRGRGGRGGDLELELRVDVDGTRPMLRVSGDFYRTTGGTVNYLGSFVVAAPVLTVTPSAVVIDGTGQFTMPPASPRLRVTIPRVSGLTAPAAAVAQFLTAAGVPAARYLCEFESPFFRRVEFEADFVTGVTPFSSYDTGLLPSGGPARTLSVIGAFAEAGVEMVDTGGGGAVPLSGAGPDAVWTNRELHASMERFFSRWEDAPGWRVWLFAATLHESGSGLRGIMFDQQGGQRQGCAVFHDVIGGTGNAVVRAQLRTCAHELGHCFNLFHSHQKEYMTPPQASRMDALSWMHYPDYYRSGARSGAGAYWAAFPFQFDDPEVAHLRHAFRNDIVMGGNPFGVGAADVDPLLFADPVADGSGLRLRIRAAATFYLGEPVVVQLELTSTDLRPQRVNARIHPNHGYVQVAIHRAGGSVVRYRPFLQQCMDPEVVTLGAKKTVAIDSAYIGYGRDGLYFDAPGAYEVRAVYHALDGSKVASNVLRVRVDAPADTQERALADQFLDDQQGRLLYLLGSDAHELQDGTAAFERVIEEHDKHPMAVYARLVIGMNAARPFKTVDTATRTVTTRQPDYKRGIKHLSAAVNLTMTANPDLDPTAAVGLDNVTLADTMVDLAAVESRSGDLGRAKATAQAMLAHFAKPIIPESVQADLRARVEPILAAEASDGTAPVKAEPRRRAPKE